MIYFDNAATTFPKPLIVSNSMYQALTKYGGNPGRSGHKMSIKAAEIIYDLRDTAASFFGLNDPERVILTKNCTDSLNMAIFSALNNGGNAVISCFEHNSVIRPLEHLKKTGKATYKIAYASFENPTAVISEFNRLIDNSTKIVICTHASNVTGKIAPIKEIAKICNEKNILFCLDASQTAGIIKIDMEKDGIDILCVPGHKSLYGPTGTGLLLSKSNVKLIPFTFGGTGSISGNLDMPDFLPDMLESGTLNVPGAAGLKSGIKFVGTMGLKKIYNHELSLAKYFYNRIYNMQNIILYESEPSELNAVPTISFNVKGFYCTEIADYLSNKNVAVRAGLHCSPLAHEFLGTRNSGTIRASFSIFNKISEIDYMCSLLGMI